MGQSSGRRLGAVHGTDVVDGGTPDRGPEERIPEARAQRGREPVVVGTEALLRAQRDAGDIHRQRIVRHDTREVVGYDLIEFISSPIHHKIIDSANQPHPGLLYDSGEINMYVQLEVDPGHEDPILTSRFITATGRMLDVRTWKLSQFTSQKRE